MKIGMTYNLKSDWQFAQGDPLDANAEFDKIETIDDVAGIGSKLFNLLSLRPDFLKIDIEGSENGVLEELDRHGKLKFENEYYNRIVRNRSQRCVLRNSSTVISDRSPLRRRRCSSS